MVFSTASAGAITSGPMPSPAITAIWKASLARMTTTKLAWRSGSGATGSLQRFDHYHENDGSDCTRHDTAERMHLQERDHHGRQHDGGGRLAGVARRNRKHRQPA